MIFVTECVLLSLHLLICLVILVVQSLSHVRLFATPWTAAHQAPLSSTISLVPVPRSPGHALGPVSRECLIHNPEASYKHFWVTLTSLHFSEMKKKKEENAV